MGKIFKALKKAEKSDVARRVGPPISDTSGRSGHEPATRYINKPEMVEEKSLKGQDYEKRAGDRSLRPETVKRHTPLAQRERSQSVPDSDKSVYPKMTSQLSPSRSKWHQEETRYALSPPVAPLPVSESDANSNAGISIGSQAQPEKKLSDDRSISPAPPTKIETPPKPTSASTPSSHPDKNIQVNYSQTRVQHHDPQALSEKRVFSVIEDFETTNQFKILRTQVLTKLKQMGGNSILVTSSNPYEGKTFTSINLGVSVAKEFDRTVLLIDADIRRPTTKHTDFSTQFFSLKVEKGLTDYLEGSVAIEEILINPGIEKLTLIPGGMAVDNSPELLNSARMKEMMLEIKNRYPSDRLVIVDGPAILHFPDAVILSRYVDGVLPVIESESTSTADIKKMMAHLADVNVLGMVLNKKKG